MPIQLIIAMNVTDPDRYAAYRAGMTPILHRFAGDFGYDLVVSEALRAPVAHAITRLFTMEFPSRSVADAFFADPAYRAVREEHFNPSTDGFTVIAQVETP